VTDASSFQIVLARTYQKIAGTQTHNVYILKHKYETLRKSASEIKESYNRKQEFLKQPEAF
jgi:hypothetical protein